MSAWVCSENHINTIAVYLASREIEVEWHGRPFKCIEQPENVANILYHENVASVNYRYNEQAQEPAAKHTYALAMIPDPVPMYKLIGCYTYQSSEHPGWEHCLAKLLCDAGERHIERVLGKTADEIEGTAEWNKAPWGID
jgi:hypothetical protein